MSLIKTITVNNRVATYHQRGGPIVCDNTGYTIKFIFSDEWSAHTQKTARFVWGGGYRDVTFSGDTCSVPPIIGTTLLRVGVYAGEVKTTTDAVIPCLPSIKSSNDTPRPEQVEQYRDRAEAAAARAEAAVAEVEEAAAAAAAEAAAEAAAAVAGSIGAVLYTPQGLTESQKAQVRANIGATDAGAVNEVKEHLGLYRAVASGTFEAAEPAYSIITVASGFSLKAGETYTLKGAVTTEEAAYSVYLYLYKEDGTALKMVNITEANNGTISFTDTVGIDYDNMSLAVSANKKRGLSVRVSLEAVGEKTSCVMKDEIAQTTGDGEQTVMSQKAVTEEMDKISDIVRGKNLFDISSALIGKRMDDAGNIVNDDSACVTDFIRVHSGDTIIFGYNEGGARKALVARRVIAYDADKHFIGLLSTYTGQIDVRVEDVAYLRMQFTLSQAKSEGQIEYGIKHTDYEEFTEKRVSVNHTVFRKGVSDLTFKVTYVSDITIVGDRIWGFYESSAEGVMDGRLHITTVDEVRKTGGTTESSTYIKHDFGHCNTVDYCEENDCLVFGNGSGDYNALGKFWVIPNAHKIAERTENRLADLAIEYDCSAYDFGSKLNVCWGYDNWGKYDVIILITNDNKNIRFAQLGKGAHNLGLGNYIEGKGDNEFNGSFKVLKEYTLDDGTTHPDSTNCNQGSDYADGILYVSVGHEPHRHWEITFNPSGKASVIECYEPFVSDDGVMGGDATEGMCVTDNYIITQESLGAGHGTHMRIRHRK